MSITDGIGQITLSFHNPSNPGYTSSPVALPDLTSVLDAVQRTMYAVAAYERHLPGIRNLSDDVRRHHTLALLSIQPGDRAIELAPLSAFPREAAPTLFSADDMARITRDSAKPVVAAAAQAVQALAACFGDQAPARPDSLAYQVRRYALTLAAVALRSGQTIRLRVADAAYQVEFEANIESSFQAVVQAAVERGEIQRYPNCTVREVLAEESALLVEIPYYGGEVVRCEYPREPGFDVAQSLDAGDEVTILGALRQVGGFDTPDVIEIAAILDHWGSIVGRPILDQLVKETVNDLMTP